MTYSPGPLHSGHDRISTGVLLVAGRGMRLDPLTREKPKCMVKVNKRRILGRLVRTLNAYRFGHLIVVTGYKAEMVERYMACKNKRFSIDFVYNPEYDHTNNIYSLYLARKKIQSPFVLMESDIVFHPMLLKPMLKPDRVALARIRPWMNGSAVQLDTAMKARAFFDSIPPCPDDKIRKTVNIYSFSLSSWLVIKAQLSHDIANGRLNEYYETVFKTLVNRNKLSLTGVSFDSKPWYEVDTIEDLACAETLFQKMKKRKTVPVMLKSDLNAGEKNGRI